MRDPPRARTRHSRGCTERCRARRRIHPTSPRECHVPVRVRRQHAHAHDLAAAIRATCAKRGTEIPAEPTALTKEFGSIADKRTQWRVFRKRFGTTNCPEEFEVVVEELRAFLTPVIAAARSGNPARLRWDAAGSWKAV
jgi:hypothetical protein